MAIRHVDGAHHLRQRSVRPQRHSGGTQHRCHDHRNLQEHRPCSWGRRHRAGARIWTFDGTLRNRSAIGPVRERACEKPSVADGGEYRPEILERGGLETVPRRSRTSSGALMPPVRVRRHTRRVADSTRRIPRRRAESVSIEDRTKHPEDPTFFLLDERGKVIGTIFGTFEFDAGIAFVDHLDISEEQRREGYGATLYQRFERDAIEKGMYTIRLNAIEEAVPFWEAMGFADAGEYDEEQKLTGMEKDLG